MAWIEDDREEKTITILATNGKADVRNFRCKTPAAPGEIIDVSCDIVNVGDYPDSFACSFLLSDGTKDEKFSSTQIPPGGVWAVTGKIIVPNVSAGTQLKIYAIGFTDI